MADAWLEQHDRPRSAVQLAETKRPEMHLPEIAVDCLDADGLASERLATQEQS